MNRTKRTRSSNRTCAIELVCAVGTLVLFVVMLAVGGSLNLKVRVPQERVRIKPGVLAAVQTSPTVIATSANLPQKATSTSVSALVAPTLALETKQPAPLSGEPAGCLRTEAAQSMASTEERLDYAGMLLGYSDSLSNRILPEIRNAYTGRYELYTGDVLGLKVDDVQNKHFVQKIMNALQVTGYVTWLRKNPRSGLHILAIPLWQKDWANTAWAPYVQAYWQDIRSLPAEDSSVIAVLKMAPCDWMVDQGLAPAVGEDWLPAVSTGWPDYASAAAAYLAETNQDAFTVARRIGWLGDEGHEGPNTMCGPLAWSILNDAGAFPPGWGGWSEGPRVFWLSMPRNNGRPWSLFPADSYHLYSFHIPMIKFDFNAFRLYPGDFLYTYSQKVGFDHMLVITEVDEQGNVYSVTNLVQISPENKTTIERVLVLNDTDPTAGIVKNQWAKDGTNGRTGHDGFDVFRWAWAEKDIRGEAVKYIVEPGDTLPLIAANWRTPVEQIARYNGIQERAALAVGQELQIPPNEMKGVRE